MIPTEKNNPKKHSCTFTFIFKRQGAQVPEGENKFNFSKRGASQTICNLLSTSSSEKIKN